MRGRLRDHAPGIGSLEPGPANAITDVAGVLVGHATVIRDEPTVTRSGVTMVLPRDDVWTDYAYAGWHVLNGNGEMTGLPWIAESGMLGSPIGITGTNQVGMVRDFLSKASIEAGAVEEFMLPVVGETWDGWLSDDGAFPLAESDARAALDAAGSGRVEEGGVGGGTGMVCHEFKGGIGTSSRVVGAAGGTYTVGVLVQANYGIRGDLRIDGVPVGSLIGSDVPLRVEPFPTGGSIIVIVATDAPLLPGQCRRVAQRATVGLARAGGYGHDSSGDLFIAFSTGNHLEVRPGRPREVWSLPNEDIDPLFHATADATEEAIVNSLFAAETMTGQLGRVVHALPIEETVEILARYRPTPGGG